MFKWAEIAAVIEHEFGDSVQQGAIRESCEADEFEVSVVGSECVKIIAVFKEAEAAENKVGACFLFRFVEEDDAVF